MIINQATFMQVCAELRRTTNDLEEAALQLARNTIPDQRRSHIFRINKHRVLVAEAHGKLQALVEEPQDGEIAGQETAPAAQTAPEGSDASSADSTITQAIGTGDTGSIAPAASRLSGPEDGAGNSGTVPQSGGSVQLDDGKKEVSAGAGESNAGTVPTVDAASGNNNVAGNDNNNDGANQGSSG